ncbi:hypothetical protein VZ95_13495 [Elstera litoralis]|jgi:uncharacterized protein (TIGR02300 family)|uniref:TIGR02300 family protein n=1 Tax=Elstera litoralis TaxID=552518 RepID=A0A0F3IRE6_9PROT|nr:TIGR02300 family protein [Elstera litoralis]KJV09113.1 hypothetical protein VZ95_13495 [Elstera litoralis]
MAKPEWGAKRICHSCGAPFYDMCRDPIVCPKCGTTYDPEAILKSRRSRAPLPDDKPVKAAVVAAVVDEADLADVADLPDVEADLVEEDAVADEDDDLMEDTSDLGEDEDDMAEVIENIGEDDER